MILHLVGGFLGSGKTTAIINAAKALLAQGRRVGVITNDQGKYLVDTAFFRLAAIPAVEVSGGCFCCNYDDLDQRLGELVDSAAPDVIFAESVGSCADIVATVVKPLLELGRAGLKPHSFSVYADARLLRRRLLGEEMPFSDDVAYIFDQQIEEAGLLVINKVDLLTPLGLEEVRVLLKQHYSGKPCLFQTSLTPAGVTPWLDLIQAGHLGLPKSSLRMDYARYASGEAQLAWLDEEIDLRFPAGEGANCLRRLISALTAGCERRAAGIGHLKFILRGEGMDAKLSFTTLPEPGWEDRLPELGGESAALLVNARVEMAAGELQALLREALEVSGFDSSVRSQSAFHPGPPVPLHRMA